MRRLLLGVLLLTVACASHGPRSQGVSPDRLGVIGFRMPPLDWQPQGAYAGCVFIDGWYLARSAQGWLGRQEHVARVECHAPRAQPGRVAVIRISDQQVLARGTHWVGAWR